MRRALAILALLPTLGATCYRPEPPKPGFQLALSGRATSEAGGAVTLDVALTDVPDFPVPVIVASDDVAEGAVVDPGSGNPVASVTLQFTSADWNVPRRLTLVGVDDDARDGDAPWDVYVVVGDTADAEYAALDATWLGLSNQDDDTPGIVLSQTSLRTSEVPGSTASFTVRLAAGPSGTVTIPVTSGLPDEGLLRSSTTPNVSDSSISLVFTPSDWSTPREVIVAGQADGTLDGDQAYSLTVGPATGDAEYAALLPQTVSVTNRDLEGIGFTCTGSTLDWQDIFYVWEGQAVSFGCVLRGPPTASVEIPFSSGNPGEALLSTGGGTPAPTLTLVFTPEDWSAYQFVTLHGVEDHLWEPWASGPTRILSGPLVSDDEAYAYVGWSAALDLYVIDADAAAPEGTEAAPLDLAGRLPWHGTVDATASYYLIPVPSDSLLVVDREFGTGTMTASVDDDGDFSAGSLAFPVEWRGVVRLAAPPSGAIYLRVNGPPDGAMFTVRVLPFQFAPGGAVAIPDGVIAGVDVPLTVSGAPASLALGAVTVTVKATHSFAYDLIFRLRSPAGTEISLVGGLYASTYSDGYPWTIFDDAAAVGIRDAADADGEFRPEVALGSFTGQDANGVWTLHVVDASNVGWSGQLEGWGIAFR